MWTDGINSWVDWWLDALTFVSSLLWLFARVNQIYVTIVVGANENVRWQRFPLYWVPTCPHQWKRQITECKGGQSNNTWGLPAFSRAAWAQSTSTWSRHKVGIQWDTFSQCSNANVFSTLFGMTIFEMRVNTSSACCFPYSNWLRLKVAVFFYPGASSCMVDPSQPSKWNWKNGDLTTFPNCRVLSQWIGAFTLMAMARKVARIVWKAMCRSTGRRGA